MHATIAPDRLQAALNAMRCRVWTFTHQSGCFCRATFDNGLLTVEVTDGPAGLDPEDRWDRDDYERAICETLDDLDKAGLLRTALPNVAAAERELRLVAGSLREIESC